MVKNSCPEFGIGKTTPLRESGHIYIYAICVYNVDKSCSADQFSP